MCSEDGGDWGWDGMGFAVRLIAVSKGGGQNPPFGFRGTLLDLDTCCSVVIIGRLSFDV